MPSFGVALYYAMARLLELRRLRAARVIGEFLQRRFGANYSVNILLATVYSQLRTPERECKTLMRIVHSRGDDIDLLSSAGESAAYAGDAKSLEEVRNLAAHESPALAAYLSGLLVFLNGQPTYYAHFRECVRIFLGLENMAPSDQSGDSVRKLIRQYVASGRQLPRFVRQSYNIADPASIEDLLTAGPVTMPALLLDDATDEARDHDQNAVAVVSCSDGYLTVFGDHYVRTFRSGNSNIVHFHVLAADVDATREYLKGLQARHAGVHYSIEPAAGKSQTYITLARFLICRDLMKRYGRDIFISDIDLQFDTEFDLTGIGAELRSEGCDFGLCDFGYGVPWARFGAGLSYFRVDNHPSDVFLDMLSRHLISLYSQGGFFSMDQTGVLLIYEYMETHGPAFKLRNLSKAIDVDKVIDVPKHLQRRKIACKWGGGGPQ